ncbi:MAG: (Fe-S)-binding protein [Candidatus Obscuribacterales bacterium]|nr:(Fe-S)-binding protein [Candidatus Obscuribacterales bacterium]
MSDKILSLHNRPELSREVLDSCIHCGLCLPACPTYLASGRETESPRGRIHLIAKWQAGELDLSNRLSEHLESCLGCLGCQTACPSGVQYEEILDSARPHLAARRDGRTRSLMRLVFKHVLPNYALLRFSSIILGLYQNLFGKDYLSRIMRSSEAHMIDSPVKKLLKKLSQWEQFVPRVKAHIRLPALVTPRIESESGKNAQLFAGCVMDIFYNHVNHASIKLMLKQGHSVRVPPQTCCGALAYHAGEIDIARDLARRNINYFQSSGDEVVVTSAGCGAMLKQYGHLFEKEPDWQHRAWQFSKRVKDLSEFLCAHEFTLFAEPLSSPITYHAACHLAHAQNVRDEPIELLKALSPENEDMISPLIEAEHCCGSAGIYNLFNTETALKVLDRKLNHIEKSGAKSVITCNPGCLIQLEAGIEARGLEVEVLHLAEILDQAYKNPALGNDSLL